MRRICVFTGSAPGTRDGYADAARDLGHELAARRIELVYGGAHVGLMGRLADAVLDRGGHVIGVIPEALVAREVAHQGLPDLRVVGSMHERKALMAELADGFIGFPGGLGTLEEVFEVLTWSQLGLHAKPCGLLDVFDYFRPLLVFLDHAVAEGFVRPEHRARLLTATAPAPLLDAFAAWSPPVTEPVIDRASS